MPRIASTADAGRPSDAALSSSESYLNAVHNRLHPVFIGFLEGLDKLPKDNPLNDQKLITGLELVLSPADGSVLKVGVVKPSGVTAFDAVALDSVQRAQPFGPAPRELASPNGAVYLHWEFRRDEVFACTTMHARTFIVGPAGGYVSVVKVGNQRALGMPAAISFAKYLNAMHNRIHPIFTDTYLASLDKLPKDDPRNDPKLVTRVELVISPDDGRILQLGVVRSSGVASFDTAAVDSVNSAAPFGPATPDMASSDGKIYIHWELHRDPVLGCSTKGVQPFRLAL